jgi:D-citramalate synthase
MKEKFTILTSSCVPIPLKNIDTDQIIPSRFMKTTSRDGLGDFLFCDWRYDKFDKPITSFVLNDHSYSGAVLVTGPNFGSGSSREHAVWALVDYGFRAIISTSFADIFKNNALNNGLLPVVVSESFLTDLLNSISNNHGTKVTIDLDNQTVENMTTGERQRFGINLYRKNCLMNGIDDMDYLLSKKRDIEIWEENHKHQYTLAFHGQIEILDTTLRDGEQTSGVSFSLTEKLNITRLILNNLNIPRIEIASCRVSTGEFESTKAICAWARKKKLIDRIEILGYIDNGKSIEWVKEAGGKVINFLAKGSERHCLKQLCKKPEEHLADVVNEVKNAVKNGLTVNIYLEDWSNGIIHSAQYVYKMVDTLKDLPIRHFMLADTLGIMNPNEVYEYCKRMVTRYPKLQFDFHAHNDYDLATSNMFAAALVGIKGLHCTINGLGERAGNAPLASVVAVVHDMLHMTTDVDEKQIYNVSHIVESFSGILVPQNKPIIGESVFTQTAGIHADGDNKNELYYNDLLPERFGRKREYALGKLSGEASIKKNLIDLGIELSEEDIRKVTKRVVALGDKKEMVTQDDLPYIVSDVTKHDIKQNKVRIVNYALNISEGLKPTATLKLNIDGKEYQQSAVGDGQYDAFVKAIHKIYKDNLKRSLPILTNYTVSIPPHSTTDALVMTNITWNYNNHIIKTRGIDADQIEAAIQATLKMLNIIENF